MKGDRLCPVYEKRVLEFLKYGEQNRSDNNEIFYYRCVICGNIKKFPKKKIFHHLCCDEICQNYTIWT